MNKITFTYEGATFTVRAKTALDSNTYFSILASIARVILKPMGISLDAIPPSVDALLTRYVQLMQNTTISGDIALCKSIDEISTMQHFTQWRDYMNEHDELVVLWWNAYQEVNKKADDPN